MKSIIFIFLFLFPFLLKAQLGSEKVIYNSGGFNIPEMIQAADLDGDKDLDVLVKEMFSNPIFWLANDGTGNFSSRVDLPQSSLADIKALKTFDFDKDGDQDVVASFSSVNKVYLWKNLGSGSFANPVLLATATSAVHSLFIADLDKDADLDIAISMEYDNQVGSETISLPMPGQFCRFPL